MDMSSEMHMGCGEILFYKEKMGKLIVFSFAHNAKHTFKKQKQMTKKAQIRPNILKLHKI